jgi:hypothetical protein
MRASPPSTIYLLLSALGINRTALSQYVPERIPMCHAVEQTPRILRGQVAKNISTWLWILGIAMLAGCGPRSDRLEVTGNVKLDGVPLDQGSIRFTSTGSEKLIASGATISNGEFYLPQEKGLPPGAYLVDISSPDTSAPLAVQKSAPGEPTLPPTARERIPAEYNSESKHTIDVTADGDNHFAFDIHSRRAK